jgi:hypothetical protein
LLQVTDQFTVSLWLSLETVAAMPAVAPVVMEAGGAKLGVKATAIAGSEEF